MNIEDVKIPVQSKPLFIVSDLHGVYDAMDLVKNKLNRENRRVVILGDCMDRGNKGIRILQEIKSLHESGKSIMYLPGNHDESLYLAFKRYIDFYRFNKEKNNMGDDLDNTFKDVFRKAVRNERFELNAIRTGQLPTLQEISKLVETEEGFNEFFELMLWLEKQPILAIETDCDGKKVALGHAAFDMELYKLREPFTLRSKARFHKRIIELMESQNTDSREYKEVKRLNDKAITCLWYRNPNDVDIDNKDGIVTLPNESEADVIVVGHTPKQIMVQIIGENMTRTAIDVDGCTIECYLSGEGKMLKFEPYKEGHPSKSVVTAFLGIGKKEAYENLGLPYDLEESQEIGQDDELDDDVKVYVPRKAIVKDDDDVKVYIPGKKKKDNQDLDDDFGDI